MKGKKYLLVALGVLALAMVGVIARQEGVGRVVAQPSAAALAATDGGLGVTASVSRPANGSFFVAGEKAVVTVTLKDKAGVALNKDDFATLSLYAYGPQETAKTVSAVKLLNATTDRSKTPHHFINLLTDTNVVLECCATGQTRPSGVEGNVFKYTFQPVTDEEPGTYTVALYYVKKGDPPVNQAFVLVDFQLGTATVEKQIVEKEKCAACHLGASNGQFYLHHVDPGRSPYGSPAIDSVPVRTCKACHNNEGYAAYSGNVNDPSADPTKVKTPDPIVRRVHGVHFGEELKNTFNNDPKTGNFKNYLGVVFPANVKNCTYCHVDDRWKTQVTRQACTACHDNISFEATAPGKMKLHPGGPQANDSACTSCHTPDSGGVAPVSATHKVAAPAFQYAVELAMTAPANGKFYVSGEKPAVTITIKDAQTGAVIDPKSIAEPKDAKKTVAGEWKRANLFVSGPRAGTKPVLTTAAKPDPNKTYANNDLRVLNDASKQDVKVSRTDTSIVYQLDDVGGLATGTYSAFVETLPAAGLGGIALLNFQVGTDKDELRIATNCTACHAETRMHASYFAVEFNPDICKNCHDYQRQTAGKNEWTDGNAGFGAAPLARRVHGVHFGRYLEKPKEVHATVDYSEVIFPQDIRNCTKCHDPKGSASWKENPSRLACTACHDSDLAKTHAKLQTDIPTADLWSDANTETCKVCHGAGKDFAVEKMHNISNPYKPPYPREPER